MYITRSHLYAVNVSFCGVSGQCIWICDHFSPLWAPQTPASGDHGQNSLVPRKGTFINDSFSPAHIIFHNVTFLYSSLNFAGAWWKWNDCEACVAWTDRSLWSAGLGEVFGAGRSKCKDTAHFWEWNPQPLLFLYLIISFMSGFGQQTKKDVLHQAGPHRCWLSERWGWPAGMQDVWFWAISSQVKHITFILTRD